MKLDNHPQSPSREKPMKTFNTLAILALTILAFADSAWAATQFDSIGMDQLQAAAAKCPGGVCPNEAACKAVKKLGRAVKAGCDNLEIPAGLNVKACNDMVASLACNSVGGDPCTGKNCDNGNPCDGIETCDPTTGCKAGTPVSCNHGKCNPTNGKCNCDKGWTLVGKACKFILPPDAGRPIPPEPDAGTDAGVPDPCLDLHNALAESEAASKAKELELRNALAQSEAARKVTENDLGKAKAQIEALSKCAPSKVVTLGIPAIGFLLLVILALLVGLSLGKLPWQKKK